MSRPGIVLGPPQWHGRRALQKRAIRTAWMQAEQHLQGISKKSASCQDISTCKSAYSLSDRTDHIGVTTMKRLDQGHLHPKLDISGVRTDMSRPGIKPGPPRRETSTLEKSHTNSGLTTTAIRNIYKHTSAQPVQNARDNGMPSEQIHLLTATF